ADRIKFHVIALQETKIKKTDIRQLNNGTFVIRGKKVPSRNVDDVGFIVHPSNVHLVDSCEILPLRIAVLRLQLSHHKKAALLFHGNSFFKKKESRYWTWESPNGMTLAEIDRILTNRRWCLLDTSVVSSFCAGSDHRLLHAKIRFSRKMEKNSLHRQRGKSLAVYDENILNEVVSKRDWQIKEDLTGDYMLLVEGLKSCAESASVPQRRRSDRISTTTKELLENRKKLKLDPTATRLPQLVINAGCRRALQENLQRFMEKKLLEAAEKGNSLKKCRRDL
ncbi:hypothetical protein Angca_001775, partial [Angiostrongylus cantonensis]